MSRRFKKNVICFPMSIRIIFTYVTSTKPLQAKVLISVVLVLIQTRPRRQDQDLRSQDQTKTTSVKTKTKSMKFGLKTKTTTLTSLTINTRGQTIACNWWPMYINVAPAVVGRCELTYIHKTLLKWWQTAPQLQYNTY